MTHVHPTQVSMLHRPLRPISVGPEQTRYQTSVDTEAVLRDPAGDALLNCTALFLIQNQNMHTRTVEKFQQCSQASTIIVSIRLTLSA